MRFRPRFGCNLFPEQGIPTLLPWGLVEAQAAERGVWKAWRRRPGFVLRKEVL